MDSIKNILPSVLLNLQETGDNEKSKLYNEWKNIMGPRIAAHSKPSLTPSGVLYIWVDQSTLAFELNQKYKPTIKKRVEAVLGEGTVSSVYIRVGQLR